MIPTEDSVNTTRNTDEHQSENDFNSICDESLLLKGKSQQWRNRCMTDRDRSFIEKVKLAMGISLVDINWRLVYTGQDRKCEYDSERPTKEKKYPSNAVNNRRYSIFTFLPLALLNQFKLFFNIFFLCTALTQFIPALQVGFTFIYFAPLSFVVLLSLTKDAWDDLGRFRQDNAANNEQYDILDRNGNVTQVTSKNIKVGDILLLHPRSRIPADCIMLHTSESSGASFIRTDQLDGETDWKLRFPMKLTANLTKEQICKRNFCITCQPPHQDIYSFSGTAESAGNEKGDYFSVYEVEQTCSQSRQNGNRRSTLIPEDLENIIPLGDIHEGLSLENTLWANCVVASGSVIVCVIYTGIDTRSSLNANKASNKRGLIDIELNTISTQCFFILVLLSLLLVAKQGFVGRWFVMLVRFIILLSSIIPISMRVNIDIGRMWYSIGVYRDTKIPGTIVRNTNIPEELGRLQYLFSDKTGTLTKNVMEFKSLQLGPQFSLEHDNYDDFNQALEIYFNQTLFGQSDNSKNERTNGRIIGFSQQSVNEIGNAVMALSLCHNVTPVTNEEDGSIEFQASSPDEVAMVKFTATVNVHLHGRTLQQIILRVPRDWQVYNESPIEGSIAERETILIEFTVVKMFPFTSERKSMSIILKDNVTGNYWFYMKGADVKMQQVIKTGTNKYDWLEESCLEMAEKGLRTLIFARKPMTKEEVDGFLQQYDRANGVLGSSRGDAVEQVMVSLESDLELLCVTGVEDQLQDDVTSCLETLGMSGVKVWMLTGDKVETATCIGRSTQLIPRQSEIYTFLARTHEEARRYLCEMEIRFNPKENGIFSSHKWVLIMDGTCLAVCLTPELEEKFASVSRTAFSVIVARCSPTQKAAVVLCIRKFSPYTCRSAAIGDGGNDVSMISAANVGIGVEGLEGKQASMAADFSITKFSHCMRLIMWHGRNSYIRTCHLAQFIIHRGIVYAVVQAVFSVMFAGTTMSVFNGYLLMGYATVFTMAPVFALLLDEDHFENEISEFPELYKELGKSRQMNTRSFLQWLWISLFQGGVMMYLSLDLFSDQMFQIVSITYTSLLITELVIVATGVHFRVLWEQRRLHLALFALSEAFSLSVFFLGVLLIPDTFDKKFFFSGPFWTTTLIICSASIGPIFIIWFIINHIIFRKNKNCFRYLLW